MRQRLGAPESGIGRANGGSGQENGAVPLQHQKIHLLVAQSAQRRK
jgi:hypothetical protein